MATEKTYPSFDKFPTIGKAGVVYVDTSTGYKYIFNQGYRLVSGSAQQINNKRPNPNGTTDLTASNVGAYSIPETNNLLNEKVPTSRTITINGDTKDLLENRDWTVGATPAGSDKQVQFNDAGNFGADADFTYDKTTNTLTTDTFKGDTLQSDSSAGVKIKSNSGSDVALFGAGGGQNATFYDGVKLDAKTASEILATDANKNIQTLTTATYPSLTELSYLKGVTSPIQTQLDAKPPINYPSQSSFIFDDFFGYNTAPSNLGAAGTLGTGMFTIVKGAYGSFTKRDNTVLRFRSSSNGGSNNYCYFGTINVGLGTLELEYLFKRLDSGRGHDIYIGLFDQLAIINPTNMISFIYQRGTNILTTNTRNTGGTETNAISTFTADVWNKFKIVINSNASSVQFYLNGNLESTHTNFIPDSSILLFNEFGLNSTAASFTIVGFDIDYASIKYNFTTPR